MTSRVRMEPLTEIENVFCPQFDYIRKDREHILVQQLLTATIMAMSVTRISLIFI